MYVPHSAPPYIINTVQVRTPYKKLVETYAEEFFSKAILCKMDEDIGTLERNDTFAIEKDVFQDPEYRKLMLAYAQGLKEALKKEKKANEEKEAMKKKKASEENNAPVLTSSE